MLVRFLALALMGWSVAEFALYWVVSEHNHTAFEVLPCVEKTLPLLLGVVMLIKARALAEWIADKLD
jgi:hypothetical protein